MQSSTPDRLSSGYALVPNLTKHQLDLQASLRRDEALDQLYAADRIALIPTVLREMQMDEILWSLTSVILIGWWGFGFQVLLCAKPSKPRPCLYGHFIRENEAIFGLLIDEQHAPSSSSTIGLNWRVECTVDLKLSFAKCPIVTEI